MAKLSLTDILGGYANPSAHNANYALIETALENTLSRDGTSPNAMEADLDLNSKRILNLGAPVAGTDAVRKVDLADLVGESALFTQTGTGAVSRTWASKVGEVVSVKDFGAAGDGTADDTAEFQLAIDAVSAAGGGTVVVPVSTGDYKIGSPVNMKSGVTVHCEPGVVIDAESVASGSDVVVFTGTVGSEFTFSAAKERGDTTISLSGSPTFADGDILHLVSYVSALTGSGTYSLGFHATDNCYFTEWNIVADDLGSGTYKLAVPFEFPGWTTSSKAKKVSPIQDAHWIGGTINRSTSGGAGDSVFSATWAYKCSVEDVVVNRGSRTGAAIEWVKSWRCEGKNIESVNSATFAFNYDVDHATMNRLKTVGSQDCGYIGAKASFAAQPVDFTYSSSSAPYSNIRSYCRNGFFYRNFEGLTSHQGCYQEQWIGNTITDAYDDGFVIRGYQPTLQHNIITSTVDVTDDLVFTAGSFVVGRLYTITTAGTTDFTLIGAANSNVGTRFVATGVGSGTGTATQADTYGVRLGYGGPRRADISNNTIKGFYGAVGVYGSPSLGEWGNILANIHDNEISHCFVGYTTSAIGDTNDVRFVTYHNNRHSVMGRWIVYLPEYNAGYTIKGNVFDGVFRYSGSGSQVAFVEAESNCPALIVKDNVWLRTKGSNAGKNKYMALIADVDDTTTFPAADWAAQTTVANNYATFANDSAFTYASIAKGVGYYQHQQTMPLDEAGVYLTTIASGVAQVIPAPQRISYIVVATEGGAGSDNLDQLDPFTNCTVKQGDIVFIRSNSSANDVVLRDVATSSVASNGFQTPGGASITLDSSLDIAVAVHTGTHWSVAPLIQDSGDLITGPLTVSGTLTASAAMNVLGAFTSLGIDDNATGERVQITDTVLTLGTTGAAYTVRHAATDQHLIVAGSATSGEGASIRLFPESHATKAYDFDIRRAGTVVVDYDDSANQLTVGKDASTNVEFTGTVSAAGNISTDSAVAAVGNILTTGGTIGYDTGAGGTVTQLTDKSTAVTLNKPTGAITTTSAALAAGAEVSFAVNNTFCTARDVPVVAIRSGGTLGAYSIWVSAVTTSQFTITISNVTGGSLSEALVLNFAIINGVDS